MKGRLIIISSPSGGGKGTLIKGALSRVPSLDYSVSWTTRSPRPDEVDGTDYHFVSPEKFETEIASDGFLEYAQVHGKFYGTSKSVIDSITEKGKDVILEIDVQGAASVMEQVPDALSIFILPPSFETLRDRLTARATEGKYDLALRLRNSIDEVRHHERFEYVVINDDREAATQRLCSVILGERQSASRQHAEIKGILDSFEKARFDNPGED